MLLLVVSETWSIFCSRRGSFGLEVFWLVGEVFEDIPHGRPFCIECVDLFFDLQSDHVVQVKIAVRNPTLCLCAWLIDEEIFPKLMAQFDSKDARHRL